jgi:hypothetical protein
MRRERKTSKKMSLYRFSERKYLEDFLKGKLSFAIASSYDDVKLTVAQRDDERARTFKPDLKKHIFVINGSPIKALKEVEIKHTARDTDGDKLDYYLMSFTSVYDTKLFAEFRADSCIEIINEVEFKTRLDKTLKAMNWEGLLGAVKYFDPQKIGVISSNADILFLKSNQYVRQQEFRAVVFPLSKVDLKDQRKTIEIGDLSDIARFVK